MIDYSSGGNINGYLDGMTRILNVAGDNTKIIPGHSPLATKRDLILTHDTLATLRDRISTSKRSGKSLTETIAAKPSANFDAQMGRGMISGETIIILIYNTL